VARVTSAVRRGSSLNCDVIRRMDSMHNRLHPEPKLQCVRIIASDSHDEPEILFDATVSIMPCCLEGRAAHLCFDLQVQVLRVWLHIRLRFLLRWLRRLPVRHGDVSLLKILLCLVGCECESCATVRSQTYVVQSYLTSAPNLCTAASRCAVCWAQHARLLDCWNTMRVSPPTWLDSCRVFLKKTHVTFRTTGARSVICVKAGSCPKHFFNRILGLVSCVTESARTQSHTRFCPIITEYTSRFRAREAVATSDLWKFCDIFIFRTAAATAVFAVCKFGCNPVSSCAEE